jgi:CHAD domain-containing protein
VASYRFQVIGRVASASIVRVLAADWPVAVAAPQTVLRRHLDTFDWGLWRHGGRLTVEIEGGRTCARWAPGDGTPALRAPLRGGVAAAQDLPNGPLQRAVDAAAGGRALLVVGEASVQRRLLRILDREGKTLVRVWFERVQPRRGGVPSGAPARRIVVEPLAGYTAAAQAVAERLGALPGLDARADDELAEAAAAVDREPGDYSSKPTVALRPTEPAERAVRRILARLIATLEANVDGTVRDLDTEFLHDLRVATRRTRTCIGQLRDVFPVDALAPFAEEFRWLATATNPCRDLDVFVRDLAQRRSSLDPAHGEALAPVIGRVRTERDAAHRELVAALESSRFATLVRRWKRLLSRRLLGGERGLVPVVEVASERVLHAYRRLSSRARALGPDAPAADLHRLRIDAKKLRYLLEFFATLWHAESAGALVAELKLVQDSLGDYHDAWLQHERLSRLAEDVLRAGAGAATLLTMGRLVAELERRQSEEVERVLNRLGTFSSPEVRRGFVRLVEGGRGD